MKNSRAIRPRAVEDEYDQILVERLPSVVEYVNSQRAVLANYEVHADGYQLPLRPLLWRAADLEQVERGVRALYGGLLDVYRHAFGGDLERIAHHLVTPVALLPWMKGNSPPELEVDQLFGRPDGFAWDDEVRFVEQNVTSGAGGMAATGALVRFFDRFPVIEELRRRYALTATAPVDGYVDYFRSPRFAHSNIGYLDARDPKNGELFDRQGLLLLEDLARRGVQLTNLVPGRVDYGEREIVAEGRRIHWVYRGGAALGALEFLDELAPLFDACARGVAGMITSLFEIVLFDKRLLPYLSDDELNGFLSDADRAAIAGVLPWTRSLRDGQAWFRGRRQDLPALCRAHQEDLVLKKGDGYGGGQVRIGRDMSATDWEAAVQAGLAEGTWIVQELVVPRSWRMPYLRGGELVWADVTAMTCPYVIEGRIRGVASRTSVPDGSRVLVGAGAEGSHAGISTAFVVADGSAAGS